MTRLWVALVALALTPATAAACASCIASAYGDRTFNWAYVGLLGLPFALLVVIGGVLAWAAGARPRQVGRALTARFGSRHHRDIIKETL